MKGCASTIAAIGVALGIIASIIGIYSFVTGNATLSSALGNPQPTVTSSVVTPSPSAPQTHSFIATTPSNFQAWTIWIILGLVAGSLFEGIAYAWSRIPVDVADFVMSVFCGMIGSLVGGLLASIFFQGTSLHSFIINIAIAFGVGFLSSRMWVIPLELSA